MIKGIGTDIVQVARIERSLERFNEDFASKVLSADEWVIYRQQGSRAKYLAKRFAAKEAAGKALGTGIGQGVSWQDFTIINDEHGAPALMLSGHAAQLATAKGINNIQISLSDEQDYAVAFVVLSAD